GSSRPPRRRRNRGSSADTPAPSPAAPRAEAPAPLDPPLPSAPGVEAVSDAQSVPAASKASAPLDYADVAAAKPAPSASEDLGAALDPDPDPYPAHEPSSATVSGPDLSLLSAPEANAASLISERDLAERADRLQAVLQDYGVRGDIIHVNPGPVVSLFELEPAPGLKASRVVGLADDIARSMSAAACRIAPVPGKNLIGIELPNAARETVTLREILDSSAFEAGDWILPIALGKDIGGQPMVADLARMPHLLIAGTTGSGKSVAINTMLLSLLYRLTPEEVRLILIDPKMLELSVYNGAPHLLAPVVTEPQKAVAALRWVVREMESRYQRMARLNVRNLESYNERIAAALREGEGAAGETGMIEREVQVGFDDETGKPIYSVQSVEAEPMPRIVVVIDEMADLMLVAGKEIERLVQRLAQMARASGIHLIMATQRPSVDVITGVIKANFPIRISFQVTSRIDSRTILNEAGAEQLLGKGDMLFTTGSGRLQRLHGPFVSDAEVEAVAAHLKAMGPVAPPVDFEARESRGGDAEPDEDEGEDGDQTLYERAVAIVKAEGKASTSFLQRRLHIGYNRAARLVDRMEKEGVVSPANHVGKREVLIRDE
ncbi:MAG: DNA translocase FtsK, partial [Pseudomonadota bacterium]